MGAGDSAARARQSPAPRRQVVYCLIPSDLAPRLHEHLRRHFASDPAVEVVVEQRASDRRDSSDRRARGDRRPAGDRPNSGERRRIRAAAGRRVAERRAALLAVDAPVPLPRRAREHAGRLHFVERIEPAGQLQEDADTARLVTRVQAGDRDAFATLYLRYFDRLYGYMRIILRDPHEAEDATQQVFVRVIRAFPRYERRRAPFRGWLFTIARNEALNRIRVRERTTVLDPEEIDRRRDTEPLPDDSLGALEWIADRDLVLFVERLPLAQRQVLLLRYMLDLPYAEIATIMGASPNEVRKLQQRATAFLRARLAAVGRAPQRAERSPWRRRPTFAGVARARRYALMP
jgi:RNA polymerase sigma-70 factor (ECF subfamily)